MTLLPSRLMLSLALASAIACGGPPAIELADQWPQQAREYEEATRAWTRDGTVRSGLSGQVTQKLKVFATFRSPDWRAAYVEFRTSRGKLGDSARAALEAEQKAAGGEHYEVALLVSTHDRRANDLQKGKRSIWSIVLVDGKGNEIAPAEIARDRRPRSEIAAELPHLEPFFEPYVARFPKTIKLLGAGAEEFSMRMSSSMGAVELTWSAEKQP